MFPHGFPAERNLSSSFSRLILLPNYDPPAGTLLCKILHFRTPEIPTELDVASLTNLAVLCDNYDRTGAVKP
ncbi:hypothetical protein K432DRAFT_382371 [Lepidopterella palustris CBS 459.81]|uniref:Uncharacterized protein n=1 Tax=Lepidopterella palustris CBS 459.81 TaxID=1314670 RepID=A0A8E2EA54_9PEZI|nr:hypothetical protein K432DRAFT_382371 [Lepidopterella palustris CBS 459.81]